MFHLEHQYYSILIQMIDWIRVDENVFQITCQSFGSLMFLPRLK
jgi:hypothetical protein